MSIDRSSGAVSRIRQPRGVALLGGGLLGLAAFASSFGLILTNPTRYEWLLNGDWAVHFMGWHLYRGGPWIMPVGATPNLGWPVGTSVGLTDSIPIFAVFFKLFQPVLPAMFQYVGLWLLTCYVLQGVFGAALMRLVTPRLTLQLLGAGLIVISPPLIFRFGHPALSAHWLLLASLWLYLKQDADRAEPPFAWWAAIAGIAAATHPYLAMMVLTLMAAAHARWVIVRPAVLLRAAAHLALIVVIAGFVLWQSGYFVVSEAQGLKAGGFGVYSMNLLAPLMPAGGSRFFGAGLFSYAGGGQYEGYAYLGAGLLLLSIVAIGRLAGRVWRARWQPRYWQHGPFALALLLFIVMALSPVVTAGSRSLFEYDPAWWGPLATFRASGRMFWPVFYFIAVAVLFAVTRFRFAVSATLVAAALALQAVDLSDAYRGLQNVRNLRPKPPLPSRFWDVVPPFYRHLMLIPTNICAPPEQVDYVPFMLIAGRNGQTINAGTAARYDAQEITRYCEALSAELKWGTVNRNTLYVLAQPQVRAFRAQAQVPIVCTTIDGYGVCTSADDYLGWQDAWDIIMSTLAPLNDFVAFHQALDDDYRNRLKRPAHAVHGTVEERTAAIMRYLGYRLDGCVHEEAAARTLRAERGERELRICRNIADRGRPLPPTNETFDFRRQLESLYASRPSSPPVSSYVDAEGEAVWLQQYMGQRLSGHEHAESTEVVLRAVRQAAPTP